MSKPLQAAAILGASLLLACGGGSGPAPAAPSAAPSMTSQPADAAVDAGSLASFTVAASGNPGPTYTWERSDDQGATWKAISGAASASYSFATSNADYQARFRAVASNSLGHATSQAARLTVRRIPAVQSLRTLVPGAINGGATPTGLARDSKGNLFATLQDRHAVYQVKADGSLSVVAGNPGTPGCQDLPGASALFNGPAGLALDAADNIYVVDVDNACIRRITPTGQVATLAGDPKNPGFADGKGAQARFKNPAGIAFDGQDLYVTDRGNDRVRKVTLAGDASTVAGTGALGDNDGAGAQATFNALAGIVARQGTVYVSENASHVIRKIAPDGAVSLLAGSPGQAGEADGSGAMARFNTPMLLSMDEAGNIYVPDMTGGTLRRVSPKGEVVTIAGKPGQPGIADGSLDLALMMPAAVLVDGSRIYLGDYMCGLRILDGQAAPLPAPSRVGSMVGSHLTNDAGSMVVDSQGNAFFVSESLHAIYKIMADGSAAFIFAGSAGSPGYLDGTGTAARFKNPTGLAIDAWDRIYVSEYGNHTIRMLLPNGEVSTLAGQAGVSGWVDGTGTAALFNGPMGLATDGTFALYVADGGNKRIRAIAISPFAKGHPVQTLAGSDTPGNSDGTGASATFTRPFGLALRGSSDLYVSDFQSQLIRRVSISGDRLTGNFTCDVKTVAGQAGAQGEADGKGSAATFNRPSGLALDQAGNLFVADFQSHLVRKITPAGDVSTLAGSSSQPGDTDGPLASAAFRNPVGLCVDGTRILVGQANGGVRVIQ